MSALRGSLGPAPFMTHPEAVPDGAAAIDLLIERLSADGRTLLWVVTRPGSPAPLGMIDAPSPLGPWTEELYTAGLLVRDGDLCVFADGVAERAEAWMIRQPKALTRGMDRIKGEVWKRFGVWFGAQLRAQLDPDQRRRSSEAGRWALRYLGSAPSLTDLRSFTAGIVVGTRDPARLTVLVADVMALMVDSPMLMAPWKLRACLANALEMANRPNLALPLLMQAADEAQAADQWSDVAWIWDAAALLFGPRKGYPTPIEMLQRSVAAKRRAGVSRCEVLSAELMALRLGLARGRAGAEEVLRDIEERLIEARALCSEVLGRDPPADPSLRWALADVLITGLGIACRANDLLDNWPRCLDILAEIEEVERAFGGGEVTLSERRRATFPFLLKLGKRREAKAMLEAYVKVNHGAGQATREAEALLSLAHLCHDLGELTEAISFGIQALSVRAGLPGVQARIVLHTNMAGYLFEVGSFDEAWAHRLATLVYEELASSDLEKQQGRSRLSSHLQLCAARGKAPTSARLGDVLADPLFATLGAFVMDRKVDLAELQAAVDRIVAEARGAPLTVA